MPQMTIYDLLEKLEAMEAGIETRFDAEPPIDDDDGEEEDNQLTATDSIVVLIDSAVLNYLGRLKQVEQATPTQVAILKALTEIRAYYSTL